MTRAASKKPLRQLVLITGLSGSGKGSALKAFEDLGFYCVDNLPVDLIAKFAELRRQPGGRIERAAVVVEIRGGEALSELPAMLESMAGNHLWHALVFVAASEGHLVHRFG